MVSKHLKIKIFVQNQGGPEFHPAGILKYVGDLKEGSNAEFERKDYFEIPCSEKTDCIMERFFDNHCMPLLYKDSLSCR